MFRLLVASTDLLQGVPHRRLARFAKAHARIGLQTAIANLATVWALVYGAAWSDYAASNDQFVARFGVVYLFAGVALDAGGFDAHG